LFAYAATGSNELPSGNLVHEGPAMPLGKTNKFAGSHILVPRGGVAVHINAFNFPIWGLLEKLAPSFFGGHALHRQTGHRHQLSDRGRGAADRAVGHPARRRRCNW